LRRPGSMPTSLATCSAIARRLSVTSPPVVEMLLPPPLMIFSSVLCAARLAFFQASCTCPVASARSAAVWATLRRPPAAGPASGWSCADNLFCSSPLTSTLA
jgi:hypothetical protein